MALPHCSSLAGTETTAGQALLLGLKWWTCSSGFVAVMLAGRGAWFPLDGAPSHGHPQDWPGSWRGGWGPVLGRGQRTKRRSGLVWAFRRGATVRNFSVWCWPQSVDAAVPSLVAQGPAGGRACRLSETVDWVWGEDCGLGAVIDRPTRQTGAESLPSQILEWVVWEGFLEEEVRRGRGPLESAARTQ